MIEYSNTINSFDDLKEKCWSGALSRLEEIESLNLEEEFFEYLQESFDYGTTPSLTEINDFIWFDYNDWIEEHKEKEDDKDL